MALRCWPAEWRCPVKRPWKPSRHEGGNLEHNNTNNNEFWDSFTTGSELGDIIFSILLALEKSSFDRLYLFGRPAKDMEGYFMANHSQRLGKIVTTYYASLFINQLRGALSPEGPPGKALEVEGQKYVTGSRIFRIVYPG